MARYIKTKHFNNKKHAIEVMFFEDKGVVLFDAEHTQVERWEFDHLKKEHVVVGSRQITNKFDTDSISQIRQFASKPNNT